MSGPGYNGDDESLADLIIRGDPDEQLDRALGRSGGMTTSLVAPLEALRAQAGADLRRILRNRKRLQRVVGAADEAGKKAALDAAENAVTAIVARVGGKPKASDPTSPAAQPTFFDRHPVVAISGVAVGALGLGLLVCHLLGGRR